MRVAMALTGCSSIEDIDADCIDRSGQATF
jgi:isopentenyl diphosphate isomerase/L-lactate dehydrogenase-like FMN-dependent dehydrogenase